MSNNGKSRGMGAIFLLDETPVGSLTNIDGLKLSRDAVDVTALDSPGDYEEFLPGKKSGGDVPITGYLDSANAGQKAMYDAFEGDAVHRCAIELPNGVTWAFDGVVTAFETGVTMSDPLSFAATVKVSGKPNLTWPSAVAARESKLAATA